MPDRAGSIIISTRPAVTVLIVGLNVGFFVLATWDWPRWWLHINYETSARAHFFAVQLFATA